MLFGLLITLCINLKTTYATPIVLNPANSAASSGTASFGFDGNTGTRWESVSSDPQWVYIDLGANYDLGSVTINWEGAYSQDYTLRMRTSAQGVGSPVTPANWTEVASITGRSGAASQTTPSEEFDFVNGTFIPAEGTSTGSSVNITPSGRYLMLYSTARATGWGNSFWELAVDGVPAGIKSLEYSGTLFSESFANDGSIANSITIDLVNDTFTTSPFVENTHYTVAGVPNGLTLSITTNSPTELIAALVGNADPHTAAQSTDFTLEFMDAAFTSGSASAVDGSSNDFAVSFFTIPELVYSTNIFTESKDNDGTVDGGTISLIGDLFNGTEDEDLVGSGKVVTGNVPDGLTVSMTRNASGEELTVAFEGSAVNHTSAYSISNLTFTFQNSAFAYNDADQVAYYNENDLQIIFYDPSEPIAYWTFDEGTGSTAADTSGSAIVYDGTLVGQPTWVPGWRGKALDFDGIADYVTVPHNVQMQFGPSSEFTIMAWVLPDGLSTDNDGVITKTGGQYYGIRYAEDRWRFLTHNNPSALASTNVWQHVTIVQDPSLGNEAQKIYVNGEFVQSWGHVIADSGTGPLLIGSETTAGGMFKGIIDEVKIFDKALSQYEIVRTGKFDGGTVVVQVNTNFPTAVNLTELGTTDWCWWRTGGATTSRKAGGTAISDNLAGGGFSVTTPTAYSWSDGAPIASVTTNYIAGQQAWNPSRKFDVSLLEGEESELRLWVGFNPFYAGQSLVVSATYPNGTSASDTMPLDSGTVYREYVFTLVPDADLTAKITIDGIGESRLYFGAVTLSSTIIPDAGTLFIIQ